MEAPPPRPESPNWGSTTKLIVGLTITGLVIALFIYFREIIGPLILAFVLAFLLHPVAAWISKKLHISWVFSVNLIYIILLIILVALSTLTGLAILQQTQSLVSFVQSFVNNLPSMVQEIAKLSYSIGPFKLDFSHLDLQTLANQLLGIVQPVLGQAGNLISRLATGAATTLGWGLFVLLISYFLLSESGSLRGNLIPIDIPGYNADLRRLIDELSKIWNTFLRGQLIISLLVILAYYVLLTILGTRLSLVIALMAGLARFVPYFGPIVTWSVTAIVAFLQSGNYFRLQPFQYAVLVVVICIIIDQTFENLVVPRLMGKSLGLHPAGVLVAAIIAANLIGLIGLVLAAPVLATFVLLARYVGRKMLDMEPWTEEEVLPTTEAMPWERARHTLIIFWQALRKKLP